MASSQKRSFFPRDLNAHGNVPIGTIIADRYEVTGYLGRGGMGFVVAARHRELGGRVAIKFLNPLCATLDERFFRERFLHEAQAAAGIENDHVVRVYDAGRLANGDPYIVMEHLSGEDLAARLETTGSMPPESVATILVEVCFALAEAHAAGIVHRDLKPENIFLARRRSGEEVVKLLDFGVAKVPEAGILTNPANVLGTPAYMSPEQVLGSREIDQRSDIWSLGIILYELLTGELPFEGDSLVHLGIVIRDEPTPRARRVRPDIPEEMDAVIARCLAKERTGRYADVGEFAQALAPFVSAELAHSIQRIRSTVNERQRRLASIAPTIAADSAEPVSPPDDRLAREASSSPPLSILSLDGRRRRRAILASICLAGAAAGPIAHPTHVTSTRTVGTGDTPASVSSTSAAGPTTDTGESVAQPGTARAQPGIASAPPGAGVKEAPRASRPGSSSAPHVRSASRPPASPIASSLATVSRNCDPPFTLDDNGIRRVKRECL